MNLTLEIPDDLGSRLAAEGDDLARRALEGFALEEYKASRITKLELRRLLGFETRYELDAFLKSHSVVEDLPTLADLEQERQDLRALGL